VLPVIIEETAVTAQATGLRSGCPRAGKDADKMLYSRDRDGEKVFFTRLDAKPCKLVHCRRHVISAWQG